MTSSHIGQLLDEALHWACRQTPAPVFISLPEDVAEGAEARTRLQPRSVARALLAEHLRQRFSDTVMRPFEEGQEPYPDYDRLQTLCRNPLYTLPPDPELAAHAPDLILGRSGGGAISVIEVGYGFETDVAMATLDRLLSLSWMTGFPAGTSPIDFVAYVFIHETGFGEVVHQVERAYVDWIEAHYGPFNGMDRIFLPMTPRLTRSVKLSPRDGTVVSAIDLETRPTGMMAFCISCERDRP